MSITGELGETVEAYVDALVQSGRYGSRYDVLREGVRLVEEREAQLALLDASLEQGIRDADEMKVAGLNTVAGRLMERWEKARDLRAP